MARNRRSVPVGMGRKGIKGGGCEGVSSSGSTSTIAAKNNSHDRNGGVVRGGRRASRSWIYAVDVDRDDRDRDGEKFLNRRVRLPLVRSLPVEYSFFRRQRDFDGDGDGVGGGGGDENDRGDVPGGGGGVGGEDVAHRDVKVEEEEGEEGEETMDAISDEKVRGGGIVVNTYFYSSIFPSCVFFLGRRIIFRWEEWNGIMKVNGRRGGRRVD